MNGFDRASDTPGKCVNCSGNQFGLIRRVFIITELAAADDGCSATNFVALLARYLRQEGSTNRNLGMDVTTVGRRLGRLSQALDAQLFEQSGAERILTERGLALLCHAENVEGATMSALAEVRGERHSLNG